MSEASSNSNRHKTVEIGVILRSPMNQDIVWDVSMRVREPLARTFVTAVRDDMRRVMPNGTVIPSPQPLKGIDPHDLSEGTIYPFQFDIPEAVAETLLPLCMRRVLSSDAFYNAARGIVVDAEVAELEKRKGDRALEAGLYA